jgi:hypothetical protein
MMTAFTMGRKFELHYCDGGHVGPYFTLASAIRGAVRLIKGRPSCERILVRDRAKQTAEPGQTVAAVERDGTSIHAFVLDATGKHVARAAYDIGRPRRLRNWRGQNW